MCNLACKFQEFEPMGLQLEDCAVPQDSSYGK
jgi:hypothetical protein